MWAYSVVLPVKAEFMFRVCLQLKIRLLVQRVQHTGDYLLKQGLNDVRAFNKALFQFLPKRTAFDLFASKKCNCEKKSVVKS